MPITEVASRSIDTGAARWLAAALLAVFMGPAAGFEQAFVAPAFVVSVPGLPNVPVPALQATGTAGSLAARGHDDVYDIEVTAAAAAQAGNTRACAGNFLRELVKQPGMPDRDSIYRAPFDTGTFLVLYILEQAGRRMLHAHLLSWAAGTHCVDAHFSRALQAGEDEDRWRTSFAGARIREGGR